MPARDRRQTMLRSISRIRRTVAAVAVALFLGAFLVVYVQLASGHDPALAAGEKRTAAAKQSTATSSSGGASEQSASSSSTEPTRTTESSSAEAVTTRQS